MRFLSLASRNMKEIYRDPLTSLLGIVMPLAFMFLFTSIYNKTKFDIFSPQLLTPGLIIFSFGFLMMFSSTLLAKDRQNAFLMRLFATPLKSSDYIFAYLLPFIPIAIFQITFCMVLGYFLGADFSQLFLVILILLLTAFSCISLGIIMGSLLTVNQVSGVGAVVITAISLFSGAWTPLEIMGGFLKHVAYSMPFAHAVDACRWLISGNSFSGIIDHFYWLLSYAVVLTLLAILAFKWKTRPG